MKINLNDYKPLRDIIFETIREAIIKGELKPGERLLEENLAEKMGVSRTPVREAIRKLELEGLVKMIPRKGAHVADLSIKDIMDVLELRATLDGLASSLAATRITQDELNELKTVLNQFIAVSGKPNNLNNIIKKDVEFHDIIYRASRNEKLIQLSNNLREQIQRFRVIYLKEYSTAENLIREHEDIYKALAMGETDLARNTAEIHIKAQEEAILKAIKET
jgi:DNA-binding GntR family transcriptional regulator